MTIEKEKEVETLNNKLNEMQPKISVDKLEEQLKQTLSELEVLKQKNQDEEQKHGEIFKRCSDELSEKHAKISELENSTQAVNCLKLKTVIQTSLNNLLAIPMNLLLAL